jgi:hypothetical protein
MNQSEKHKLAAMFSSTAVDEPIKEILHLLETKNKLEIDLIDTGRTTKGVGPSKGDLVSYTVKFDSEVLLTFDINNSTGDVLSNTVKVKDSEGVATFFMKLAKNLITSGLSSLKN